MAADNFNFAGSIDNFQNSYVVTGRIEAVSGNTHSILFRVPPGLVLPEVTVDNVLISVGNALTGETSTTNFDGESSPNRTLCSLSN